MSESFGKTIKLYLKDGTATGIKFAEIINNTILYAVAFRKKLYNSLEEMQRDLDEWMKYYNQDRAHSGRYCYGKTPMETFKKSLILARQKMIGQPAPAA